jgi:preprotein translocase subunit YajC
VVTYLAASSSGGGSAIGLLLPLLLVGAFFLLLVRPQRQRQRRQQQLQSQITIGQEVMTTAGIFGTVTDADAETVSLEVSPGVRIRVLRQAVSKVVSPSPLADPLTEPEDTSGLPPEDRPPSSLA